MYSVSPLPFGSGFLLQKNKAAVQKEPLPS